VVEFNEHLELLRKLRVPYKKQLIKYLWHVFREHQGEIIALGFDKFLTKCLNLDLPPNPIQPVKP